MYSFHVDNHSIRKDAGQRMRQHGAWLFPLGTKSVQGAPTLRFLSRATPLSVPQSIE
jgi:hypothetical protein